MDVFEEAAKLLAAIYLDEKFVYGDDPRTREFGSDTFFQEFMEDKKIKVTVEFVEGD